MSSALTNNSSHTIEINNVLKNTYMLLSATLGFSALLAWFSSYMGFSMVNPFIMIGGYFILLFLVHKTANSSLGILMTFAFTGWMGFTLGPILSAYASLPNGGMIIAQALGGTALLFICLSGYVILNKTNMTKLLPFITIGILVAFVVSLINVFFLQMPMLSVIISAAFLILSSALLMWQTSSIVNGGERNYILATITIFVSLYNIFLSLLNLLTAFGDD
jgi:modulator of FtsH protease